MVLIKLRDQWFRLIEHRDVFIKDIHRADVIVQVEPFKIIKDRYMDFQKDELDCLQVQLFAENQTFNDLLVYPHTESSIRRKV